MSNAATNSRAWRERHPDRWKAIRDRYYRKNRRAIIFAQRLRNAGLKPPPLSVIREKYL